MRSQSRKGKNRRNVKGDEISRLPDAIISHILSFLPMKSAVQTSILSTRWRNLWTSITNFEFEGNMMESPGCVDIVDHMLSRCTSNQIDRFSLVVDDFHVQVDVECFDEWVNEALSRNVRELNLDVWSFPVSVFTCKTLTVLKLNSIGQYYSVNVPTYFDLPNLKTLHMHLRYQSELTEKLFSNCPVLEDLYLAGLVGDEDDEDVVTFNLACPLLKRLEINVQGLHVKILIIAPNLKCLEIDYESPVQYVVSNLASTVEAEMHIAHYGEYDISEDHAIGLLKSFGGVKSLKLNYLFISLLYWAGACLCDLPPFYNMNRLELFVNYETQQEIMACFLNVCPNLEILRLHEEIREHSDKQSRLLSELGIVPECLLSSLEVIELEGFKGTASEMDLVKYLLANARVLKKLTIKSWRTTPEQDVEICKQLLELPRGSTCGIHLC